MRRPGIVAAVTAGAVALAFGGNAAADAFITGQDVKNNSLPGADIRNGTVSGADVKNGSLTGRDIKTNSVTWEDIANGTIRSTEIRNGSIELQDMSDEALNQLVAGILSVLDEIEVFDTLDGLEDADLAFAQDVADLREDLAALAARVSTAEGTLATVVSDAAAIDGKLTALTARVEALESTVGALEDAALVNSHWGTILRNVNGAATAILRFGPSSGADVRPPAGTGSLELNVNTALNAPTDVVRSKTAFGNEVDFAGKPVTDLGAPSFWVYQTGESNKMSKGNLPNITIELNPDVAGKGYTSLVFVPTKEAGDNVWTEFTVTDGYWYFTNGSVAAATVCGSADNCTLESALSGLGDNAVLYTVGVGKGRDSEWHGAVDKLTIGEKVYDFEARGVIARDAE